MKIMYSKQQLKAAAVYIAVNNPHLSDDWKVIYKDVKKRMMDYAKKNAAFIDKGSDEWCRFSSTGGIMLVFSAEGEYIDVDVYVTPRFGDCKFIEKEL